MSLGLVVSRCLFGLSRTCSVMILSSSSFVVVRRRRVKTIVVVVVAFEAIVILVVVVDFGGRRYDPCRLGHVPLCSLDLSRVCHMNYPVNV